MAELEKEYDVGITLPCRWKDGSMHRAEIVSKRISVGGSMEYYVHYSDYDRRLDEWVAPDTFASDVVDVTGISPSTEAETAALKTRNMKRKFEEAHAISAETLDPVSAQLEKEREEATKVKNVGSIILGKYEVDAWYFSPYPLPPPSQVDHLFICEYCLKYMCKPQSLVEHKAKCPWRHPPHAQEIYRGNNVSIYEADGKSKSKLFCQNMCLLAKLFLDHKTLYFDVEPFLFYILTENDEEGSHIVGYFSKEKFSPDDYNIACILTLPPYQRKGYGRFLIQLSYELSKRENRLGTPERPLSDMGLVSFRSFWAEVLLEILHREHGHISIRELSERTSFKPEDIISTLNSLNLVKFWKGQHVISVSPKAIEDHLKRHQRVRQGTMFEPERLIWAPKYTGKTNTRI